ncbi:MAG: rhodanese-like domain-containing protein [Candidatus Dasytiphilus stammeri]
MSEIIQFYSSHLIICNTWLILLVLTVVFTLKSSLVTRINLITCTEATLLMNKQSAQVIDIRTQQEYYQGHICNSINILSSNIKKDYWQELVKQYKSYPIIIVGSGRNNIEENQFALQIKKLGFLNIYILEGGIIGWNKEHLPLVSGKMNNFH